MGLINDTQQIIMSRYCCYCHMINKHETLFNTPLSDASSHNVYTSVRAASVYRLWSCSYIYVYIYTWTAVLSLSQIEDPDLGCSRSGSLALLESPVPSYALTSPLHSTPQ